MSNYFETGVRFNKVYDDGSQKAVTERYVIDAMSFSEVEARIAEEMQGYQDYKITMMTEANFEGIFLSPKEGDDTFFKVKVLFKSYDDKSGKEKKLSYVYLVQSSSIGKALERTCKEMSNSVLEYRVTAIVETKIVDIIKHKEA